MQLSDNLVQSVINYLLTKPYNEVVLLLWEIQKELSEQSKQPETPKKDK